jgi:hypothetical protein
MVNLQIEERNTVSFTIQQKHPSKNSEALEVIMRDCDTRFQDLFFFVKDKGMPRI